METSPSVEATDFPACLDDVMANQGARESFTWGPQTLCWLCGLMWFFVYVIRDVPEAARNAMLIAIAVTIAALAGVIYAVRRSRRRIVLYPYHGRLGCYRGGSFLLSFTPAEMRQVQRDFFVSTFLVLKTLLPLLALIAVLVFLIYEAAVKKQSEIKPGDLAILGYLLAYAVFAFVAIVRSNFILRFFWIPNGKDKTGQPVHFSRKELCKLKELQ